MASKMPLLNATTLRERAKQILRDHSFDSTLFALKRGDLDVETLLEELHIYHAELRIQQEALLESQEAAELALSRFSRLYQELPLPVLRIDWAGFLQDANSAAHRCLALNRRLFTQLSEAKHRSFLENALERARHDGRADCQAVRLRRTDGRPLIADVALIRLPEPDGAKPGFICSIVDQTLLIQQRDALLESYARLQESEDNYRILAAFSPDWDFWLGHDGEFRYISPACARITGYSSEDFMNDSGLMERIIHPDDLPRYQTHRSAADKAPNTPLQFRILTQGGETRWVEHVCNPVLDAHGQFMGYRGINRDITDRQKAQASLEHQLRFQAMLANISSLFVNTRIEHLDPAVVEALQQIGHFFQADRCRILEYSADRNALELTHHWSGLAGDEHGPGPAQQLHATQLPWTTQRMRARDVLLLEKGPGQPPEFAREHRLLSPDNARSVRLVPMISDGEILGVLLLETFGQLPDHHWQEQPDQMRVVSENLAGMIIRCRAQQELQESEARYRHICAVTSDIAYSCRKNDQGELHIDWITDSIQSMTGYGTADIHARGFWGFLVMDEDQAVFKREILELEPGRASCCELRLRSKIGPPRWVRATTECIQSPHEPERLHLYGGLVDITEQNRQQSRIQRLALVVEQSPSIVLITDREARIEYINARFSQLTGFSRDEIQGHPLALIHPDEPSATAPSLDDILHDLSAGRIWSGELSVRKKSGERFWEQAALTPLKNAQGEITHFVKMSEDLSDRKALSEQLSYLAHYDPLTGLPKRSVMRECIQQAMIKVRHNRHHLAIFSIDVDDLKRVNDSLGHAAGDELLRILSGRLKGLLGKEDSLARLGGDHFLLLKAHMAQTQDALHLAERINQLMEQPLNIHDQSLVVTASTGIALFPGDADTVDELMRRGDAALHRSKNDGGERAYCFFTPSMDKQLKEQFQLEQALRRGLERDEFLLHFQPRVDMTTGRIQSLEALVRWLHP
ncbi:PAS domain S-box protein, partial [Ectothiorhodospira lacustris]